MTLEEVEALERAYEEAVKRGEIEEEDRYSWKPGDVVLYKNEQELREALAKEGREFIPVEKMQKKSRKKAK